KAEVLALSFAYRNPDANDLQEIESIAKELAGRTSVLIGGSAAVSSRKRLIAVGALVVEDLAAFRSELARHATQE
ncbi:MAG TPA: hypothetical protein VKA63_09065, partial [Candidatus Krumholzibacteria bacterium]|nr:hypothetical protein [Candidatus Krumholzibacteria bacterium]